MDQIANSDFNENCSIIGEKDQVLQILLKKLDSIVIKKQCLYYMSSTKLEEIYFYNRNNALPVDNQQDLKNIGNILRDNNLIRLKNKNSNFEYVGISNGGNIFCF